MSKGFAYRDFHKIVEKVLHDHNITNKKYLSKPNVKTCYDMLPDTIKKSAMRWGCSDTIFKNDATEWLNAHWK